LAHSTVPYRFAAQHGDLALVTPQDRDDVRRIFGEVKAFGEGRDVRVIADVVVFLGESAAEAEDRKEHLDGLFGHRYRSDAFVFVGTPDGVVDLAEEWADAGIDGFRLRPGGLPGDLEQIGTDVVPLLRRRSLFPTTPRSGTLRERFGWDRPANRYAPAGAEAMQ
jgi:alkanesulfonate monooxygenase SsuD/methylene tetrahydromethanopterin reductase-like flavin-dependent oxidoreductase (luciferase family)